MTDEAKAVEESAKAVQEVAKVGGKVLDIGRDAGGWLDRIFGNAIEDTVALLWTDRVAARRVEAAIYSWERLTKLVHKVEGRLKKKGVKVTRFVPPKVALPLLEHATMENEDELHSLWANLLASAMDPSVDHVHRKFVSTLAEMTGTDAVVLKEIYWSWTQLEKKDWDLNGPVRYEPGVSAPNGQDVAMITLHRLGLVDGTRTHISAYKRDTQWAEFDSSEEDVLIPGDLSMVIVTKFGECFCAAVLDEMSEPPSKRSAD